MLGPGTVLKGRWRIAKKVGQGAFGEIYSGYDLATQENVAIKVERWDSKKAVLKLEVAVLKKMQVYPHVCRYVHCGHFEEHNYLVMELLGINLSELRRHRPQGRFSLATTARLGIQMIRAVEAIHEIGYLHRDIKPSNFAIGLSPHRRHQCVMIDFGLTRKFRLPNGDIRPAREVAGFRGTARYASINSHLSKELSRRDDLWSVFYVLIEFCTGQLPWRKLKEKEEIGMMKIEYNKPELVQGLPSPFLAFMQHLQSLEYPDAPSYDLLVSLLQQLDPSCGTAPYDWVDDSINVTPGLPTSGKGDASKRGTDDPVDRREQLSSSFMDENRILQSIQSLRSARSANPPSRRGTIETTDGNGTPASPSISRKLRAVTDPSSPHQASGGLAVKPANFTTQAEKPTATTDQGNAPAEQAASGEMAVETPDPKPSSSICVDGFLVGNGDIVDQYDDDVNEQGNNDSAVQQVVGDNAAKNGQPAAKGPPDDAETTQCVNKCTIL